MPKDIHVPARIVGGKIPVKASLGQTVIVTEGADEYTGEIVVTPSESEQTLLTKDKLVTDNISVNPIPSEYTDAKADYDNALVAFGVESGLADGISALTEYSNEITGQTDENLSDAVRTLADGYGPSASVYSGSYTPSEDTLGPSFDIGGSDFSHFFVFASTDVDRIQNRRAFVSCYTEFGEKDIFSNTTNNSGILTAPRFLMDKWFVKNGQTVICTNTGASGGGNTGYWLGGVTYNWFAW